MKNLIVIEIKNGMVHEVFSTLPRGKTPEVHVVDRDGESVGEGSWSHIEDVALITKRAAMAKIRCR